MSWVLEKQREPLHRDVRLLMLTRNTMLADSAGGASERLCMAAKICAVPQSGT